MVVVATALVIEPHEQCPRPAGAGQHGVHDRCEELVSESDVLRVLLRRLPVVRLDHGELGKVSRGGIGIELLDRTQPARPGGLLEEVCRDGEPTGEVVAPGDAVGVELIEDRPVRRHQ